MKIHHSFKTASGENFEDFFRGFTLFRKLGSYTERS